MKSTFYFTKIIVLLFTTSLYAEVVEQKKLMHKIDIKELSAGKVFLSNKLLKVETIKSKYPEIIDIDSINLLKNNSDKVVVSKISYIVDKPIENFSKEKAVNTKYLTELLNAKSIKRLGENKFSILKENKSYELSISYDSDEMSTITNSKEMRATNCARKLDTISQTGSSIIHKVVTGDEEKTIVVTSHIPIEENKTLIISYQLTKFPDQKTSKMEFKKVVHHKIIQEQYINRKN